ncbi:hypothetical protein Noda2021_09310 [Candidatus Dependentiae bacterium Noda2021]|nr:hypothetical protein Noda2021_09310 [Candidatus Dependentiae bacterium Noda2021]
MNRYSWLLHITFSLLFATNLMAIQEISIKEDDKGNSYLHLVAQRGLCGYVTLQNKLYDQTVLEAFLYSGNTLVKKLGRYEWHNPTQPVQFSFDSAGRQDTDHYRIYCYPRYGDSTDKSSCKDLVVVDFNQSRTRASCTVAAPWAGGRGTIPFKPLCMDALYKSSECTNKE